MNLLLNPTPLVVLIEGREYDINSDFRTSIQFELVMLDGNLTEEEKMEKALELYYPVIPSNLIEAVEQILWFYRGGKEELQMHSVGKGANRKIYNYNFDDDYIYSAFLSQYGIDLNSIEYLHWWKFKAMFKALKEDNMIVKIMGYRSMDLSKIKDKEQRAYYKEMQNLYALPKSKEEIEKINAIEDALLNNKSLEGII